MCGPPCVYVAPAYAYVENAEYAENSSETSDTDEDEHHNTWNALLEVLTMPGSSPAIQQSGWHCRATSRWTVCTFPWNGKQGSDCRDAQIEVCGRASTCLKAWKTEERLLHAQPHCEYGTIRGGNLAVGQELRRLDRRSTKAGLGPCAPRTGSSFA